MAAGGCRSAESRAAERAQDACIGSLQPVADGGRPSTAVLRRAAADADAAAGVDDRWAPLRASVRAALDRRGSPRFEAAVDALVEECERVNEIVRRGGEEPPGPAAAAAAG